MDQELEELDSLLSDHFGRTPGNSQASSSQDIDDAGCIDSDNETDTVTSMVAVEAIVEERTRDYVQHHGSDTESSEEENNESEHDDVVESNGDLCKIEDFLKGGCGCKMNCHTKCSVDELYDHILNVRDMEKHEKELYIMGTLNDVSQDTTKRGKKRQRLRYTFRFCGRVVCKKTFLLCYDIGRTSLQNILTHVAQHGVTLRKHGNYGKSKPHSLKYEDVQRVVSFINNHADVHGIPQPAAPRGRDNIPPVYLSADTTKCQLHKEYVASCSEIDPPVRTVKLSAFKTIWLSCLPHIRIASPRDDVCASCEKFRKAVADAVDEESKWVASTNLRQHILQAQNERDIYNECIKKSVETNSLPVEERYVHYTFDFSQCVSLPHYARQMGPLYFLSLRKVQIFGFRIDGVPQQLNFIVNEGETMGGEAGDTHVPNSVISMVDWALENRGQGVLSCTIHADNCPGQNKNKYVLGYFAWRVMTGQHSNIEYLMQIPGHARCLVDGGFAHIKKLYRRSDCETMDQIETLVNKSSSTNIAIRYPEWQWRDWKAFLSRYFKPLVGIRKFQYFRFSADEPGVVTVKENYEGQEKKICLLKDPAFRFENIERPYRVGCQGLTVERQRYLQRFVRPYVRPTNQNDFCSEPVAH